MDNNRIVNAGYANGVLRSNEPERLSATGMVVVPAYFTHKILLSRLLGAILLVFFSPAMLLSILAVRLTSSGPAIFCQRRLGKHNLEFCMFKFRTMHIDAEEMSGPTYCQPGDPRITPVGRLLRFLHLDELPQLWNVVKGEMGLVGPRPERAEIIELYNLNERFPVFTQRTRVLPGVTGLAQINLPADLSPGDVEPKVKLDLEYIETANFILDLRILICTAMRMLGIRHGRAVKLFGLIRTARLGNKLPKKRIFGKLFQNRIDSNGQSERSPKQQPSYAVAGVATEKQTLANPERSPVAEQQLLGDVNETELDDPIPNRPR